MNKAEVETRARIVVSAARKSQAIEDDNVELKREWPPPESMARQLAGIANRSNGGQVLYLIGLDECTGAIHTPDSTDVADWWPQVQKHFREGSPDLVQHLNIEVVPGEVIVALVFSTNAAPYMIVTPGGRSPELEIPIREGARTRSARRHEILAMVAQQQGGVEVLVLRAALTAGWRAEQSFVTSGDGEERIPPINTLSGTVKLFFTPESTGPILLPLHDMTGELLGNGHEYAVRLHLGIEDIAGTKDTPIFGVRATPDGIVMTGPGSCIVQFSASTELDIENEWSSIESWVLSLQFGIAQSSRHARTSVTLSGGGPYESEQPYNGYTYGSWSHLRQ